jgi:DGQHR domain-containing protein
VPTTIRRQALLVPQHRDVPLYLFTLRAANIERVAGLSRLARDEEGTLVGYQRPAVRKHVKSIAAYLNGPHPLFPNALILALRPTVRFEPVGPDGGEAGAGMGYLEIPVPPEGEARPGWIVDGQQRALALEAMDDEDFVVPVAAFVTADIEVQRDQFLRVNSVKPLPRGLITELLPTIRSALPPKLEARRAPSRLCDRLAQDPDSPFHGLIRRPSTPRSEYDTKRVKDTPLVKAITRSLTSPSGALFHLRNVATGEVDAVAAWTVLRVWWTAVARTFPDAWGHSPRESRLMHSAGIQAMGHLMDRVMPGIVATEPGAVDQAMHDLAPLRSVCAWTGGRWLELDGIAWNDIQCTSRHIRLLSAHLADVYTRHAFSV